MRRLQVDIVIGADGANSRVAKEIDAGDYDYAIAFQVQQRDVLTVMPAWRLWHAAADILVLTCRRPMLRNWQACSRSSASACFALASRPAAASSVALSLSKVHMQWHRNERALAARHPCPSPLQKRIHTPGVEQDTCPTPCMSPAHPDQPHTCVITLSGPPPVPLQERIRIPDDKMAYYKDLAEMYVGDDVSPDFYGWVFPKYDHVAVGTGTVVNKSQIKQYQQATRDRSKVGPGVAALSVLRAVCAV